MLSTKERAFLQAFNDMLVEMSEDPDHYRYIHAVPVRVQSEGNLVLTAFSDDLVIDHAYEGSMQWREIDIHLHIYPEQPIDGTAEDMAPGESAQLVKVRQI